MRTSLPPTIKPKISGPRWAIFQAVILLTFLWLVVRIYQIQFTDRALYTLQADQNRFDQISLPATRGIILDRYGVPLAVNVASGSARVTPALLPSDDAGEMAVLEKLAGLLRIPLQGDGVIVDERGFPQRSLLALVREGEGIAPYRPVVVKTDVPENIARLIIADSALLPGVDIEWIAVRDYPTGPLTADVIGYMGPIQGDVAKDYEARGYVLDRDRIGYDGIEFSMNDILSGNPGIQIVERDVAGAIVRTIGETRQAQPGYSLRLTLDSELQAAAQKALQKEIDYLNTYYNKTVTQRGVVVATNPRTGEVLAMVSWPTYDNERFARGIDYQYYLQVAQDPLRPLFNQAIGSLYPPGSIFKVMTLTAVLEEGIVTPDKLIEDPGHITLSNRYYQNDPGQAQKFVCWIERGSGKGHGLVDAIHAIAWSCDVYFYKVGGGFGEEVPGIGLGIERLGRWMDYFGLGQYVNIELAGEIAGVIPSPDWKRRTWGENWSTGDTYNSAFGQGYVTVTPLQMLQILNTIANDGVRARPTLIYEISDENGNVIKGFQPDLTDLRDRLRADWPQYHNGQAYPDTLSQSMQVVRDGMRAAVTIEGGTALGANLPYVTVAGKTGTAEYCDDQAAALELCIPGAWPSHAWFMTYAPVVNPEISIIAFVYNGGEGALVALPVARDVMEAYFKIKTRRAIQQQLTPAPTTLP
jgi:penicillin-binding protein 2